MSGAIYAVLASGLVLTYQTSGIFNFAHGAIAFSTAFLFFQLNQPTASGGRGLPIVVSALLSVGVFAPALGLALDRIALRRLAGAPESARAVGTIGLLVALPALALWCVEQMNDVLDWGLPTNEQVFQPPGLGPTPKSTWRVLEGVTLDSNQVAVFAGATIVAVALWLLLRHTRLGLETRAAVDRPSLAHLRGVDVQRRSAVSWMLSSTLAGLGGVLIAPIFQLDWFAYVALVFASFTAAVFGRMRSIPLVFAGGLLLGVVQNLVQGYAPDALTDISGFRTAVPFLLLLGLLVWRGAERGRAAGSVAEEAPPFDPRAGLPAWRRALPWVIAAVGLVVYEQWVADDFWAGLITRGLALGLVFLSFVVVTGMGGMVSLAQAAFVTAGGFTAGYLLNHRWPSTVPLLMNNGRFSFIVAAIAGAAVAALAGVVVALPSLRLGGLALALATLALAFTGEQLVFQVDSVRNGSSGWSVPAPSIGPFDFADDRTMAMLLLAILLSVSWMIHNLAHSATGRAIFAVRSSEVAASTAGISQVRAKLALFAVSAAIAGFGGVMLASVMSPFSNTTTPAFAGIVWLAVTVTFGVRRTEGAILAGLVFALFPEVLSALTRWETAPWAWIPTDLRVALDSSQTAPILFGLGAISLAREPDGTLALTARRLRERRERRASRRAGDAPPTSEHPAAPETITATITTPVTTPVVTTPVAAPSPNATSPQPAALVFEGVRAGYGDVEVLHGVDLALPTGHAVALLGANGAGKSTLAAVAAGLVAPRSGRILRDGRDVTAEPAFVRARGGLLLAPEARGVFPGLTVDDNLAIRLRHAAQRESAYERFPILGERRRQVAGLLSGGEQQMLALAAALVDPPAVLIADEPSLGLAPLAVDAVFTALAELRDRGVALLLIEEKAREVLALADTVAFVRLGRIVWRGPREEAGDEVLAAAYLGDG